MMMEWTAESTCMLSDVGMNQSTSDRDFEALVWWLGNENLEEERTGFSSCGGDGGTLLGSQNLTPNHSSITAAMDSYSPSGNLSYGSPDSANKPKSNDINEAKGAISVSSLEQSDVDELSTEPIDLKRKKRRDSNRDSARRSRIKRQAHVADLELQVGQLRVEKASLYNQYSDIAQKHHDASTNNQLWRYRVAELRAKIKLAESMFPRGSTSFSLTQHPQSNLFSPQQVNCYNIHGTNVLPTINVCQDDFLYAGMTVPGNSTLGLGGVDGSNGSLNTSNISDATSCVSDMWSYN
ncbi:hypothetical protein SLEP1_g45774 [Rubroshorea leprosula]|uniref:BZIP domain-containing protein n=1 Tax=Rubroshorea leprosula TaxID=152421 RepID=A0AAV5LKY0_9ROSI|nr:hypothetical protein SLEP1_g45774 [Rubroshorea leprosula]